MNHSIYNQTCSCGHLYQAVTCIKKSPFSCLIIDFIFLCTIQVLYYASNDSKYIHDQYQVHFLVTGHFENLKIYIVTVNVGIGGLGLWRLSVLLVEETGVPGKNHRPVASH
jgi:hypothetical protein